MPQCLACKREIDGKLVEGLCGPCVVTQETCERSGVEFWGEVSTLLGEGACCRVCLGKLTKAEKERGFHRSCLKESRRYS